MVRMRQRAKCRINKISCQRLEELYAPPGDVGAALTCFIESLVITVQW